VLPFLPEYRIKHERFPTHASVAYLMSMVTPACAVVLSVLRNLNNLWIWGACSGGLALALCLHSAISMHRAPQKLSRPGRLLVERSDAWFPYFFVVIQSIIASLIVAFVWFSLTTLALPVPVSVHAAMILLVLLVPFRRYAEARMIGGLVTAYDRRFEYLRGAWHVLVTFIITHVFMAITAYDVMDRPHDNIHWQTTLWVPAILYMLFALIMMLARLKNPGRTGSSDATIREPEQPDRF